MKKEVFNQFVKAIKDIIGGNIGENLPEEVAFRADILYYKGSNTIANNPVEESYSKKKAIAVRIDDNNTAYLVDFSDEPENVFDYAYRAKFTISDGTNVILIPHKLYNHINNNDGYSISDSVNILDICYEILNCYLFGYKYPWFYGTDPELNTFTYQHDFIEEVEFNNIFDESIAVAMYLIITENTKLDFDRDKDYIYSLAGDICEFMTEHEYKALEYTLARIHTGEDNIITPMRTLTTDNSLILKKLFM